jgi:hypothetical protein
MLLACRADVPRSADAPAPPPPAPVEVRPQDDADAPEVSPSDGADAPANDGPFGPALLGSIEVFSRDEHFNRDGVVTARFDARELPRHHRPRAAEGACQLVEFTQGFCEPPCPGICASEGRCQPLPLTFESIGPLTVRGLLRPMRLLPAKHTSLYLDIGPPDRFAPDAEISVEAQGTRPLALAVRAVPPLAAVGLDLTEDRALLQATVIPGRPLILRWTPADPTSRVRAVLNSPNQAHGHPFADIIECEAPDAEGTLSVPPSLLAMFPRTAGLVSCVGIDCPLSMLMRYRRNQSAVPGGRVELVVSSQVHFHLFNP